MLYTSVRWICFLLGGLLVLGGFAAAAAGGPDSGGIWAIVLGAAVMIAAVLQRPRYRSGAAESSHADAGPGGGEDGFLEPRFLPTTEVFIDPTSRRPMRVFVDPLTGERRYRAEG
ncbi:MAG: hypothetical protein ABSA21_02820 [Candidatus Limnocylindrales bacterium]|jgi:hypothetical protein